MICIESTAYNKMKFVIKHVISTIFEVLVTLNFTAHLYVEGHCVDDSDMEILLISHAFIVAITKFKFVLSLLIKEITVKPV